MNAAVDGMSAALCVCEGSWKTFEESLEAQAVTVFKTINSSGFDYSQTRETTDHISQKQRSAFTLQATNQLNKATWNSSV